ncbi:hypothetical protein BDAP_000348 [Binucleata daphniae]
MNITKDTACKFCYSALTDDNVFACPCKCTGSLKYVHLSCLDAWISRSKVAKCELCNYVYKYRSVYKKNILYKRIAIEAVKIVSYYSKIIIKNIIIDFYLIFSMFLTVDLMRRIIGWKWSWFISSILSPIIYLTVIEFIKNFGTIQREVNKAGQNNLKYAEQLISLTKVVDNNRPNNTVSNDGNTNTCSTSQNIHNITCDMQQNTTKKNNTDKNNLNTINNNANLDVTNNNVNPDVTNNNEYVFTNEFAYDSDSQNNDFTILLESDDYSITSEENNINILELNETSATLINDANTQISRDEINNAITRNLEYNATQNNILTLTLTPPNYTTNIQNARQTIFYTFNMKTIANNVTYFLENIYNENFRKLDYKQMHVCVTQISVMFIYINLYMFTFLYVPYLIGSYILSFISFNNNYKDFHNKIGASDFLCKSTSLVLGLIFYLFLIGFVTRVVYKYRKVKHFFIVFRCCTFMQLYNFVIYIFMTYFVGTLIHYIVFKEINASFCIIREKIQQVTLQEILGMYQTPMKDMLRCVITLIKDTLTRHASLFYDRTEEIQKIIQTDSVFYKCTMFHPNNVFPSFILQIIPGRFFTVLFHFMISLITFNIVIMVHKQLENTFRKGVFYYYDTNIIKNHTNYKKLIFQSYKLSIFNVFCNFLLFYFCFDTFILFVKMIFTEFYINVSSGDKLFLYIFIFKYFVYGYISLRTVIYRIFRFSALVLCYILKIQNYFLGAKLSTLHNKKMVWCSTKNERYSRNERKIVNSDFDTSLNVEEVMNINDAMEKRFMLFHIPRYFNVRCFVLFFCLFAVMFSFMFFTLFFGFELGKKMNVIFRKYYKNFMYLNVENVRELEDVIEDNVREDNVKELEDVIEDNVRKTNVGNTKENQYGINDNSDINAREHGINNHAHVDKYFDKIRNIDFFVCCSIIFIINILELLFEFLARCINEKKMCNIKLLMHDALVFVIQNIGWSFLFAIYIQSFIDKIVDDDDSVKIMFISKNYIIGFISSFLYTKILFYLRVLPRKRERRNFVRDSIKANIKVTFVLMMITLIPIFVDLVLQRYIIRKYRVIIHCCICFCPFGTPFTYFFIVSTCKSIKQMFIKTYDFLYLEERKIRNYDEN